MKFACPESQTRVLEVGNMSGRRPAGLCHARWGSRRSRGGLGRLRVLVALWLRMESYILVRSQLELSYRDEQAQCGEQGWAGKFWWHSANDLSCLASEPICRELRAC